jgi:hypothetical protein
MKTFSSKLNNVLKFDIIRLLKLLEISQYAILSFLLSVLVGGYLNDVFGIIKTNDNIYILLIKSVVMITIISILTYYIRKISMLPNFIFTPIIKYYKIPYTPSKKNESLLGVIFGMGYVFLDTQKNFNSIIDKITTQIK